MISRDTGERPQMKPEVRHRSPGNRGSLVWFLVLFLLVSCRSLEQSEPIDRYIGPAFVYPFTVLDRVAGADGILWQHDRTDCPVDVEIAESIIEEALGYWSFPGTCSFRRAKIDEEATLTIGWRASDHGSRCYRFGISEALVAHRVRSPRSGDQTLLSIHLNVGVQWSLDDSEEPTEKPAPGLRVRNKSHPRLKSVIVHEAGHVLGLAHAVQGDSVMRALQGDAAAKPGVSDLIGVQSLYGGGEGAGSADLQIFCVAPDGQLHLAAPIIRGLAPPDRVRVHSADLDGDDRDELLLVGRGRPGEGTGLLILIFGAGALLERSLGPFPGMLDGERPLAIGRTASGDAVLAQPVGKEGKYHSILLTAGRPPLKTLPRQTRWVSVAGGGGDADGDGLLDSLITGIPAVRTADLDGDGSAETILRGTETN